MQRGRPLTTIIVQPLGEVSTNWVGQVTVSPGLLTRSSFSACRSARLNLTSRGPKPFSEFAEHHALKRLSLHRSLARRRQRQRSRRHYGRRPVAVHLVAQCL